MKTYKITMMEQKYENLITSLCVNVEDSEHPSPKAIELYHKMGWDVKRGDIRILKVERIA